MDSLIVSPLVFLARSRTLAPLLVHLPKDRLKKSAKRDSGTQVNISGLRAAIDVNRALGRRLLWVFLLTICFAVMLVQMTDRVRHYLSEPVAVQVSVARNTSLTYPAITICNKVRTHAQ